MGQTKIEWTATKRADGTWVPGFTFNAWYGCQKVGPPCDHCYAESWAKRSGLIVWGPFGKRQRSSTENWQRPIKWNAAAKAAGERRRVFSLSLGDWLDNKAPQDWRMDFADLIKATPDLDWLLLTKRIQNFERLAPWVIPPPNVWLGITCGDQAEYDLDWPLLRKINAAVRFISHEPSLGPLSNLREADGTAPDWVICGGESGPQARWMDPAWARALHEACAVAGTKFFMKQMTGKKPIPDDLMVREFPR